VLLLFSTNSSNNFISSNPNNFRRTEALNVELERLCPTSKYFLADLKYKILNRHIDKIDDF